MERLDTALCKIMGFSRSYAQECIKNGFVSVNAKIVTKPGLKLFENDKIECAAEGSSFVGRGGYKLDYIMEKCKIDVQGLVCADIGASSGGFTDCLLKRGAKKVYAVDVGTGQLNEKLKNDPRVVCMEKTDIRNVASFPEEISFASADLSFISFLKVIDKIYNLLPTGAGLVVLIKPQFEIGKENIGNGVIKNTSLAAKTAHNTEQGIIKAGFELKASLPSPIRGGDGNWENLSYFIRTDREP